MKRLSTLVCALLAWSMVLWAAPVDEAAARQLAAAFLSSTPTLRAGQTAAAPPLTTAYVATRTDGGAHYYVFNRGRAEGFVIVSGDDRAETVLGYTDRGAFHPDSIPPAMRWWLGEYAREMEAALHTGRATPARLPRLHTGLLTPAQPTARQETPAPVAPLLGDILWDQGDPYNRMCPTYNGIDTAPTGCGATAMAQIMRYWQHPVKGTGKHTYFWQSGGTELSANFGITTYYWDRMLSSYAEGCTPAEADAVSTLMRHCGVSIDMDYGPESGSQAIAVPLALHSYFGYDGAMAFRSRDFYTTDEWEALVLAELQAARPVFYSGQAIGGGHAFVCDGYDGQGYFHINWGWSGLYNGHFLLHALNPEGQGTGGYEGGYNSMQQMVTGIQPDRGGLPDVEMVSEGMLPQEKQILKESQPFSFLTTIFNMGWNTVRVDPGLLFYDAEGVMLKAIPYKGLFQELKPGSGWGFTEQPYTAYFPRELADGTYTIRLGFRTDTQGEWQPVRMLQGSPACIEATVEGKIVRLGATAPAPELTALVESSQLPATITQYEEFTADFLLGNEGEADFNGGVCLLLFDEAGRLVYNSQAAPCNVPVGRQSHARITDNLVNLLPPGHYRLGVGYVVNNRYLQQIMLDNGEKTLPVEVIGREGPALTVVTAQSDLPATVEQNTDFTFTATLTNAGADFDGTVCAVVADRSNNAYFEFSPQTIRLARGETSAPLRFTGNVRSLEPGTYLLHICMNIAGRVMRITPDTGTPHALQVEGVYTQPALTVITAESDIPDEFEQDKDYEVKVMVENKGTTFAASLYLLLFDERQQPVHEQSLFYPVTQGKKGQARFKQWNVGELPEGQYYLAVAYPMSNGELSLIYFEDGLSTVKGVRVVSPRTHTPAEAATDDTIRLYPNPATDHVTVRSDDGLQGLRLYSLAGTLLRDESCTDGATRHRLDLHSLPAGTYLLTVKTATGLHTERLMKR